MEDIPLENIDRDSSNPDGESNVETGGNVQNTSNEEDGSKPIGGSNTDARSKELINCRPSWWKLTLRELVWTSLIVCTTVLIIVTSTTCHRSNTIPAVRMPEPAENTSTCMTSGCIHTASRVLKNMDPEVDPCDNFYRFACGRFISRQTIPHDLASINNFIMMEDKVTSQIRIMLEEPINKDEPKPFVLVKNFYKACMNTSLIKSRGFQPFLQILDSFGGWPVLKGDNWDESGFDWQKTVLQFRKKGFQYNRFFTLIIDRSYENPHKLFMDVRNVDFRASFTLEVQFPFETRYYKSMVDTAVLLGAPRERAELEMRETILFEIKIALLSTSLKKNPVQYTITELQNAYPIVNWMEYINEILPPGFTINEIEVISVEPTNNLKELEETLRKTPKRVIANYLMWKTISENSQFLTIDMNESSKSNVKPRFEYCTERIMKWFYNILYSLYARKYFNADAKSNVVDMVSRIKAEVAEILKDVDWMDEDTRKLVLQKNKDITAYIGYSDDILDVNILEEYYKDVNVDENKFVESYFNMKAFTVDKYYHNLKDLHKISRGKQMSDFTKSRPLYMASDNRIQFPLGVFGGMFFSTDRPQYMNYGAIGFSFGHEITHGIHHQGSQILLKESTYKWSSATEEAYLKKVQCMHDQYGNYTVQEVNLNINSILTLSENIADNGGIKAAYLAYIKWVEDNEEEQQLPGLDYTPRQMFWLSAANVWCAKYGPEAMKIFIEEDKHSPHEFRIVGPLSNSKDFAKDFQCPPGSPMNPERKCKVF